MMEHQATGGFGCPADLRQTHYAGDDRLAVDDWWSMTGGRWLLGCPGASLHSGIVCTPGWVVQLFTERCSRLSQNASFPPLPPFPYFISLPQHSIDLKVCLVALHSNFLWHCIKHSNTTCICLILWGWVGGYARIHRLSRWTNTWDIHTYILSVPLRVL